MNDDDEVEVTTTPSPPPPLPGFCPHERFHADVKVRRNIMNVQDGAVIDLLAEMTVTCASCGTPMKFTKRVGLSHDAAKVAVEMIPTA